MIDSSHDSLRHWSLKEKARGLRSQGLSYREIREQLPVSKSSISLWCRNVPLTNKQKERIFKKKRGNYMNGIRAIQNMFWKKQSEAFHEGQNKYNTLKNDRNFIAGLMLYWAEGSKSNTATITNSDPDMLAFMSTWFTEYFAVKKEMMCIHMHLHSGQNERESQIYWSKMTGVKNFKKTFIKPEGSGYRKNILHRGTIALRTLGNSTYLLYRIFGATACFIEETTGKKAKVESWVSKPTHAT